MSQFLTRVSSLRIQKVWLSQQALIASALLLSGMPVFAASFSSSVFATGSAVSGTAPDSVTYGNGSIWVSMAMVQVPLTTRERAPSSNTTFRIGATDLLPKRLCRWSEIQSQHRACLGITESGCAFQIEHYQSYDRRHLFLYLRTAIYFGVGYSRL